jgi:hypothetical protein
MNKLAMSIMDNSVFEESVKESKRHKSLNERKKCFYKYCKNMRPNATDLYCCNECKTLARELNQYKL